MDISLVKLVCESHVEIRKGLVILHHFKDMSVGEPIHLTGLCCKITGCLCPFYLLQ